MTIEFLESLRSQCTQDFNGSYEDLLAQRVESHCLDSRVEEKGIHSPMLQETKVRFALMNVKRQSLFRKTIAAKTTNAYPWNTKVAECSASGTMHSVEANSIPLRRDIACDHSASDRVKTWLLFPIKL